MAKSPQDFSQNRGQDPFSFLKTLGDLPTHFLSDQLTQDSPPHSLFSSTHHRHSPQISSEVSWCFLTSVTLLKCYLLNKGSWKILFKISFLSPLTLTYHLPTSSLRYFLGLGDINVIYATHYGSSVHGANNKNNEEW